MMAQTQSAMDEALAASRHTTYTAFHPQLSRNAKIQ